MAKRKLPEQADAAGNIALFGKDSGKEFDYSDLGVDGQERSTYTNDLFCQGPEADFDEFH